MLHQNEVAYFTPTSYWVRVVGGGTPGSPSAWHIETNDFEFWEAHLEHMNPPEAPFGWWVKKEDAEKWLIALGERLGLTRVTQENQFDWSSGK